MAAAIVRIRWVLTHIIDKALGQTEYYLIWSLLDAAVNYAFEEIFA